LALLNWELYVAFVPVLLALLVVPGPTLALVALNTAHKGRRSGLHTVMGITVGKLLMTLIVIGLLSTVLSLVESYGYWVRWFGAAIIFVAAIRAWHSTGNALTDGKPENTSHIGSFIQGFMVALTSPTTFLFLAIQMPIFIDVDLAARPQLFFLSITYLIAALLFELTCVSLISLSARQPMREPALLPSAKLSAVCLFGVAAMMSPLSIGLGL